MPHHSKVWQVCTSIQHTASDWRPATDTQTIRTLDTGAGRGTGFFPQLNGQMRMSCKVDRHLDSYFRIKISMLRLAFRQRLGLIFFDTIITWTTLRLHQCPGRDLITGAISAKGCKLPNGFPQVSPEEHIDRSQYHHNRGLVLGKMKSYLNTYPIKSVPATHPTMGEVHPTNKKGTVYQRRPPAAFLKAQDLPAWLPQSIKDRVFDGEAAGLGWSICRHAHTSQLFHFQWWLCH